MVDAGEKNIFQGKNGVVDLLVLHTESTGLGGRLHDTPRGLMPERYCRACSVISMLGLVLPQAIMFHLTSSLDVGGDFSSELLGRRGLLC